jgi:hypothetical protein
MALVWLRISHYLENFMTARGRIRLEMNRRREAINAFTAPEMGSN